MLLRDGDLAGEDAKAKRGLTLLVRLPERAPDAAGARMQHLYEDVRVRLAAPLVDSMFTALANYPGWLQGAWCDVRDVAASASARRAARRLTASALTLTAGERELAGAQPLLAVEADARALTEASLELLPKLMLVAAALERSPRPYIPPAPRRKGEAVRTRDFAVRRAAEPPAISLIDPRDTSVRVAAVLEDVRERHGHPIVATYYRGLANWAAHVVRLWAAVRPVVGTRRYGAWRDALAAHAEREWQALSPKQRAPASYGLDPHAVAAAFRAKILPELLLDVAMLAPLVDANTARAASPASSSSGRASRGDALRDSPAAS